MDNQGITKKQFWIQMISTGCNLLLGIMWTVWGILSKKAYMWIFGILFLALSVPMVISLVNRLKHHRIEDPKQDEEDTRNVKDVLISFGMVLGLIAFFFLVVFGLSALFK